MGNVPTVKIRANTSAGYKTINADDPRATPENIIGDAPQGPDSDLSREGIAILGKADLVELIEAHGVEVDKRSGIKKLREMALKLIFVDM